MIVFEKIWEDPDLVELRVRAAHAGFAGGACAYFTMELIDELASGLRRFADLADDSYFYETESRAVGITLRKLDELGHLQLAVSLSDEDSGQLATVCIPISPAELDDLAGQLSGIAHGVRRRASLGEATT
ncbi:MAG TPA: hypothetical protein VGQ46_23170 [Thermoanaerobaculia bacterium]|jgi:hypothetical protein|nr:hypothetical protein [Thermoanaerobaculia bacterium]